MLDAALVERRDVAEATTSLHFARPPDFQFTAGQAVDVVLQPPSGRRDDGRDIRSEAFYGY